MKNRISDNLRRWLSLVAAVLIYYVVHEGSHLIYSAILGAFEEVRFLGLGVQIVINDTLMSNMQLALFCVLGSVASLVFGYLFVLLSGKIVRVKSKYLRAICFYSTVVLLFADSIYLAFLYRFVGGGDMNGIKLFGLSEIFVQIIYAVVGIVNLIVFIKYVYPKYKVSFEEKNNIL